MPTDYDFETTIESPVPVGFVFLPCPHATQCFCCGTKNQHADAIVVAVAVTVRDYGAEGVCGGVAYHFGKDPELRWDLNDWHASTTQPPQTLEKSELMACFLALKKVEETCQLSKVVIKTHSPSLVHTLTQTLPHFKAANYQYVPADIATGLQQLDSQMMKLEDVGIRILFWEVGVDQTPDADFGAEYAIDQVDQDPGTPTSQWW